MSILNIPKPLGIEKYRNNDGIWYSLDEIIHIKNKINQVVNHSQQKISSNLNINNLIDYTILYEYSHYNHLFIPSNLIRFFSFILDLYSNIPQPTNLNTISISQFDNLSKTKYENVDEYFLGSKIEKNKKCPICIRKFIKKSKVTILDCKHIYHTKCISKWLLKNSNECPMCKRKVT